MRISALYTIVFFSFFSCKKDVYETIYRSADKDYFNQTLGSYSIFDVYEILYDDFSNTSDTFNYQIKEYNESFFIDNLGRPAVRVDRYKRNNDTANWQYLNTWYSVSDSYTAERVEDNKRFLKLSFPISIDAVWNSNELNMDNVNNVFYGIIHQPYKLNLLSFDSAVSVESTTINTISKERSFKEIYAKKVGLVFKNVVFIDKSGTVFRGNKTRYILLKHVP